MEKREKCTRSYVEAGKTHGLFHSISYPTKSFIFCKSLLFFQNKGRNADSSFCCKFVSILFHFTLILLKLENALITADLLNQNLTKNVMLLDKKLL